MAVLADLVYASIGPSEHGARYRPLFSLRTRDWKSVFPVRRGKLLFCLNNGSNDNFVDRPMQEMEQRAGGSRNRRGFARG